MLDLKKALLCPEHKSTFLGDHVGAQGLIVIGVGKGGERGFHMTYRFSTIGAELDEAGISLVLVYPKASVRHVMDPLSVAAARFRRSPALLLDVEDRVFRQSQPARRLSVTQLDRYFRIMNSASMDLDNPDWAGMVLEHLRAALSVRCEQPRTLS